MDDLFVPLTPANPAAPKPKCRRHTWWPSPTRVDAVVCTSCGRTQDAAASRRGRTNRQRGNSIERELGKKLGMARTGQYGGKDDLSGEWLTVQVKSGTVFSERIWGWLQALPANGKTRAVIITDAPGAGHKRRAMIVLDLDEWVALHGEKP